MAGYLSNSDENSDENSAETAGSSEPSLGARKFGPQEVRCNFRTIRIRTKDNALTVFLGEPCAPTELSLMIGFESERK